MPKQREPNMNNIPMIENAPPKPKEKLCVLCDAKTDNGSELMNGKIICPFCLAALKIAVRQLDK